MNSELLYGVDEWVVIAVCAILFCGVSQLAFLYGRHTSKTRKSASRQPTDIIEGAIFSLMALLLGFTFMMSMSRFDTRSQSLVEESNHIKTTFLRAQVLPNPYSVECRRLLRDYVEARLALYRAGIDPVKRREAMEWSDKLQGQLWAQAVAVVRQDTTEVTSGYFIESLNSMIEDHTRRVGAINNHVPEVVLLLLTVFAAVTLATNGYIAGLNDARTLGLRLVLIFLITSTLLVTIDLDRPRRGLIRVNDQSLLEVQKLINP